MQNQRCRLQQFDVCPQFHHQNLLPIVFLLLLQFVFLPTTGTGTRDLTAVSSVAAAAMDNSLRQHSSLQMREVPLQ